MRNRLFKSMASIETHRLSSRNSRSFRFFVGPTHTQTIEYHYGRHVKTKYEIKNLGAIHPLDRQLKDDDDNKRVTM